MKYIHIICNIYIYIYTPYIYKTLYVYKTLYKGAAVHVPQVLMDGDKEVDDQESMLSHFAKWFQELIIIINE